MPNISQRVQRGIVRGAAGAGISSGLGLLAGTGFNPYAAGLIFGTTLLDSLFSEEPPPPPPTRQQILFAKNIYRQYAFGYLPVPMRTLFGGSFRRLRDGLPDKWLAGISGEGSAAAAAALRDANEDYSWSCLDMVGYFSHGAFNPGGVRGIFFNDQYVALDRTDYADYGENDPLYYATGWPIGGNPDNDYTGKVLFTPSFGRPAFPTISPAVDLGDIYRYTTPAWFPEYHNSNISYGRVTLIEPLLEEESFWRDRDFPNRVRLLTEGIKVFDLSAYPDHFSAPRVFTDNAISIRYFFETQIAGLLDTDLDMGALLESYNYAEEIIPYDYRAYTAQGALLSQGQDDAVYTDRLPNSGRRYAFNGIISTEDADIRKVRDRLDFACNGRTVPSGSGIAVLCGKARNPTQVSFSDVDYHVQPKRIVQPDIDDAYNAIRVRYNSQMQGFNDREVVVRDLQAIARDGQEIVRRGALAIEDAPNDVAVSARVIAELIEHREDRIVEAVVIGIRYDVRIGDVVHLSCANLEIRDKLYVCANRELNFNENTTKFVFRAQTNAYADRFTTPDIEAVVLSPPTLVGRPGPTGKAGLGIEQVFCRHPVMTLPTSQYPSNDWGYGTGGTASGKVWTPTAPDLNAANPVLLSAARRITGAPAVNAPVAEEWTVPRVVGRIGLDGAAAQRGEDGNGVEYVFQVTATAARPTTPANSRPYDVNNHNGDGWHDGAPALSDVNKYLWRSARRVPGQPVAGTTPTADWGDFSSPVIVGRQGDDGAQGLAGVAGADGTDGNGVEFRFAVTPTATPPALPPFSLGFDVAHTTWRDAAPAIDNTNQFRWQIQRRVPGTPLSTDVPSSAAGWGNWSMAVIVGRWGAGTPGDPGPAGAPGADGADGVAGEDGTGYEYIFTSYSAATLPSSRWPNNVWGYDSPATSGGQTWYDGAPTLTASQPYLFSSQRKVEGSPSAGAAVADTWSSPSLVGRFGIDGQAGRDGTDGVPGEDGRSYEFIFARTARPTTRPSNPSNSWGFDRPLSPWSDAAPGLTSSLPVLWRSYREVSGTPSAGAAVSASWNTPHIIGRYGIDGQAGRDGRDGAQGPRGAGGQGYEFIFARSASGRRPSNPLNSWGFDSPSSPWSDAAPDLNSSNPVLWRAIREVVGTPSTGTSVPANWGPIRVVGRYGVEGSDGTDGQPGADGVGVEYIFCRYGLNSLPSGLRPNNSWAYDSPSTRTSGGQTLTWHDGAVDLHKGFRFLFRSERKVVPSGSTFVRASGSNGNWSTPEIIGHYSTKEATASGARLGGLASGSDYIFGLGNEDVTPSRLQLYGRNNPTSGTYNLWGYWLPATSSQLTGSSAPPLPPGGVAQSGQRIVQWYNSRPATTTSNPYLYTVQRFLVFFPATNFVGLSATKYDNVGYFYWWFPTGGFSGDLSPVRIV